MSTPTVSIIILSYNQSEYLLDAVESVINQTTDDWELIVIDNGSTDNSQELLLQYKDNKKIKLVFHEENRKITMNCNQGISLASGQYVGFLFADDYYLPDKLAKEIECFESLEDNYGVIHSPSYSLNVKDNIKVLAECIPESGWILKDILTRYGEGFINPITPLVKKECFINYPFYEEIFTEGEGIYFKIAMKYKFYYMPEPTAVMREHGKNMRFAKKKNAEIFEYTIDHLSSHKDFPLEYLSFLLSLKASILASYGWQDIRLGTDTKWARSMFRKAIKADISQLYKVRTLVGLVLSFVPVGFRVAINKTINIVFGRRKIIYMDEYYK